MNKVEERLAKVKTGRVFEIDKMYGAKPQQRACAEKVIEILNADVDMKTVVYVFQGFKLNEMDTEYVRKYVSHYAERGLAFWDATAVLELKAKQQSDLERA